MKGKKGMFQERKGSHKVHYCNWYLQNFETGNRSTTAEGKSTWEGALSLVLSKTQLQLTEFNSL